MLCNLGGLVQKGRLGRMLYLLAVHGWKEDISLPIS